MSLGGQLCYKNNVSFTTKFYLLIPCTVFLTVRINVTH